MRKPFRNDVLSQFKRPRPKPRLGSPMELLLVRMNAYKVRHHQSGFLPDRHRFKRTELYKDGKRAFKAA